MTTDVPHWFTPEAFERERAETERLRNLLTEIWNIADGERRRSAQLALFQNIGSAPFYRQSPDSVDAFGSSLFSLGLF